MTKASEVPANSRWRPRRVDMHLFLISFATLSFELACIRWFGSTVLLLTFSTNLILMACFPGISVGCLAASRPHDLINVVLPLAVVAMAPGWGALWAYHNRAGVTIDVGGQQSPQQIFFAAEYSGRMSFLGPRTFGSRVWGDVPPDRLRGIIPRQPRPDVAFGSNIAGPMLRA